ncbi:MAG TPA: glycoside hydrolase family 2 TIM barrel-domain containing protein [Sphingobium sp.]
MTNDDFTADRREALAIAAGIAVLPVVGAATAQAANAPRPMSETGRDLPFSDGWLFFRGGGEALEQPVVDDKAWRRIDLPHDWSIEDIPGGQAPGQIGPFDKKAVGTTATGFTVGGEGWYRKHFKADGFPADARVEIMFDGVYLESEIFLNGAKLGGNVHGYLPFSVDLTPHLDRKGDNVLAVRVRNLGRNSRWYSGSGLYRPVTLDILPAGTRIARWGVAAWTRTLSGGAAEIDVTTTLEDVAGEGQLVTRLVDVNGKVVAEASSIAGPEVKQTLKVRGPRLWSPDAPNLYRLETEVRRGGKVVDQLAQPFGVRIVTFDPQRGMAVNGKVMKLRGGCIHHDNGLLGARAFADADDRRVRLMKARGYNAVRSSHNPASRSLRDACDRLGMLLIEEAFDAWHERKEPQDFSVQFRDHWQEVIRGMVLSARNSPSVIMWSIGNEIPYRATDEGVQWEWRLANAVRRIDPTRPVTAALNGGLGGEMIAAEGTARPGFAGKVDNASTLFLDVPGYNYRFADIEREQVKHPDRIVYASETFPREVFDYRGLMDRAPYFLGEFVWTAMDYIGEAGLGATVRLKAKSAPFYFATWPWVNAWCGDIDLIGQQKAPSLARDVAWDLSAIEVAVQRPIADGETEKIAIWGWSDELASWSWPGSEGKPLAVRVYSSADRVELRLNGKKLGEKALTAADKYKAEFSVPYAPGVLEALAYRKGKLIGRRRLETVGDGVGLRLGAEKLSGRKGRDALLYLPLDVLDAKGRVLPDDQRAVSLSINGPAELLAFGSANPLVVGSLQAPTAQTYRGRALAILRGTGPGKVEVEVRSPGIAPASTSVTLG